MSEETAPERIAVVWSPEARAELRAIDRKTALEILYCIDRYLATRTGDVKKLRPPLTGFRLPCGDYRVFFDANDEKTARLGSLPPADLAFSLESPNFALSALFATLERRSGCRF